MLRRLGQALRIGLASDGIALVRTSRWKRADTLLAERHLDTGQGPAAIGPALRELLAGAGRGSWPVSVVLADDLVRMCCVTPPPACSRMTDLKAAASLRFQTLYGASATDWKIAADWNATSPFLAAAVPCALVSALEQATLERRCHLVEIVPHFVAAMNRWRRLRRPGSWFGVVNGQALTMGAFDGQALAAVCTAAVPLDADRGWLESVVAREALRVGLACPEGVQIAGSAPGWWASSTGRLKFGCSLLDADPAVDLSDAARLACTGRVG